MARALDAGLNFAIFGAVWYSLSEYLSVAGARGCTTPFCTRVGYHDDWRVMSAAQTGKTYLSLCVTIQLLKLIKFCSALVPKMGLAPLVLKRALPDLIFFVAVFFIT